MEIEGYNKKEQLKSMWIKVVYKVVNYDYKNNKKDEIINEYNKTYEYVKNELKSISINYEKDYVDFRLDCYKSLLMIINNL
jgi:hypothetical protein